MALIFILAATGLTTLYSATTAGGENSREILYTKQIIWYSGGLFIMIIFFLFDYKNLERWSYIIYAACVCSLICVLIFGKYVAGSRRWLAVGPISVQPSEMAKIAVIIILSRYYARHINTGGLVWYELITPFIITMIPFALIVRQPDLGTAMLIFLIATSVTVFVKIEKRTFICLLTICMSTAPMIWFFLKGYQKQRILTFLDPDRDPLGAGYHIIQSKIAIGSGMLFGKGLTKGTQNALAFLPEQHTDFIFSVFSEEWGFAGASFLVLFFLVLIVWALNISYRCRDSFGTILSVGLISIIFWQVFINIGMVMGLMPVVGVPLPFISYGGSSVITTMMCMGILMNISMRQFIQN